MPSRNEILNILHSVPHSRARATAIAAVLICGLPGEARHGGRGPEGWDDLGVVRAACQAAIDLHQVLDEHTTAEKLSDVDGYPEKADTGWPYALRQMLLSWGLTDTDIRAGQISREARSGDIVIFAASHGPHLGVVVEAEAAQSTPFALASVWPGIGPAALRRASMNRTPLFLLRWPETLNPLDRLGTETRHQAEDTSASTAAPSPQATASASAAPGLHPRGDTEAQSSPAGPRGQSIDGPPLYDPRLDPANAAFRQGTGRRSASSSSRPSRSFQQQG